MDRLAIAESRDDDAEANRRFGRRHRHHEKDNYLAVHRTEPAANRDEREIYGVEHQLDRHEHHQNVAADDHARHADGEDDRAQRHHVGERNHDAIFSISRGCSTARGVSWVAGSRRASAIEPTTAASSSTEVTSKATR